MKNPWKLLVLALLLLGVSGAYDPGRVTIVCDACDGTGAQTAAVVYPGGWCAYQVTCTTTGGDTWPDSVVLEARHWSSHNYVTVKGFVTSTADERQGVFFFSPASSVRVDITDSAGSHTCYVSLGCASPADY